MLLSPAGNNPALPQQSGSFWNKFTGKGKPKDPDPQPTMAVARQKLLTLAFDDMETIRVLPNTFAELDALAREWTKPPPGCPFTLRVPVEFASFQASRLVSGPYIYLTGEDSFQIATMGVQGMRVEVVADVPPPPDEPPPPPPPPVLEMPAGFNLELTPGNTVGLEVAVVSDDLDMSRMEDGTVVDGQFWGCLDIVHQGDTHKMEFSGTRLPPDNGVFTPEFMMDAKTLQKLAIARRPTAAKCNLTILAPSSVYCELILSFNPLWSVGTTWPIGESIETHKVKYFVRCHPGGALEHIEQQIVTTAIYYEAIPEPNMITPEDFVGPRNSFAMSFRDFVPHLNNVLDQLGMSIHARTQFVNNGISAFAVHKNIAYRLLSPSKVAAAIDITVTQDPCVFTRIFMIWRGVSDDEMSAFVTSGEKEANVFNWREVIGWSEESKDTTVFRVLETSMLELC